jgi:hypothetical protein
LAFQPVAPKVAAAQRKTIEVEVQRNCKMWAAHEDERKEVKLMKKREDATLRQRKCRALKKIHEHREGKSAGTKAKEVSTMTKHEVLS